MNRFRTFFALITAVFAFSIINVNAFSLSGSKPSSPTTTIERQVFKKILSLPYYGVFDFISFKVNGGTVTLSGKVNSLGTKRDAESAIKNINGVSRVVNNIENLPPSSFDDSIRRRTLRTFAESGGLSRYFWEVNPDVRIIVDRGHVTLEGFVANSGDYNTLNILANGVTGVFSVSNHLIVGKGGNR